MGVGLGLLRLAPAAFWAMTPRELEQAARVVIGPASGPPDRAALARLMQIYPD